ncbi:MAG: zinc-dependent metalloprotease [Solirubrobacteraceae bacterium MAG38_C4-C5]|nr:zinc-dependent metalloprotease [Candidatus Siliceabacter maunaloa]
MIPWALAEQLGAAVAGDGPAGEPPGDVVALCADAAQRVVEATGMVPSAPLPEGEAIERRAWIAANLRSLDAMLAPLTARVGHGLGPLEGPARAAGGMVMAGEAGALTGLLAQRVLGQYELVLLDARSRPRLLLVRPNVLDVAARLGVDPASLLRWVCIHEVTHAVQFGATGWLREHLAGLMGELIDGMEVGGRPSAPRLSDVAALMARLREGGLVLAFAGPQRRELLDRIQATMALIEGHAEHVMDLVGEQALPDLPKLRAALDRRRARQRPPLVALLERLLGLDLKLRQYEQGRVFCDTVARAGGQAALRHAFAGPDLVPTAAELADPAAWLRRTGAPRLALRTA